MQRKALRFLTYLLCMAFILAGCTDAEKEESRCAKCGGKATTTISGPLRVLEMNGIPKSKCWAVTSVVYAAHLCETCVGDRVVDGDFTKEWDND